MNELEELKKLGFELREHYNINGCRTSFYEDAYGRVVKLNDGLEGFIEFETIKRVDDINEDKKVRFNNNLNWLKEQLNSPLAFSRTRKLTKADEVKVIEYGVKVLTGYLLQHYQEVPRSLLNKIEDYIQKSVFNSTRSMEDYQRFLENVEKLKSELEANNQDNE